ncbi:MAG: hypothetical protein ACRDVC_04375 [Acidimicrobiales bacterium]
MRELETLVLIGAGTLADLAIGHLVAFETDEVDEGAELVWSVLVRGLATRVEAIDTVDPRHLPSPLVPAPGHTLISVRPDAVSGRRFALQVVGGDPSER